MEAGRSGSLQAGSYDLSPSLRPSQIVAALRQEAGEEVEVTLTEGWRLEEIVGYLGTTNLTMNLEDFAALATDPPTGPDPRLPLPGRSAGGSHAGGLPGPEHVPDLPERLARRCSTRLLTGFGNNLTDRMLTGFRRQGLTLDEAVNLASIVEREAVLDEERAADRRGLPEPAEPPGRETVGLLNADPTLQYGLATAEYRDAAVGRLGRHRVVAAIADWRRRCAAARRGWPATRPT